MKQVVFTARHRAELVEVDDPGGNLGPDEVTGPTLASVISAGTELGMQYGDGVGEGFPHHPGYGAVFTAERVGAAVADVRVGDRLFCLGKHAGRQRWTRDEVVPVPAGLDPAVAALARMAAIAWSAREISTATAPEPVVVSGLGAVGHFAARCFAAAGYPVTAVDPDAKRRALLARHCDCTSLAALPARDPDDPAAPAAVIECAGVEPAVYAACLNVRRGGEVLLVGVPWADGGFPARDILWKVFWRGVRLRSGYEWQLPWAAGPGAPVGHRDLCQEILADLAAGRLPVEGLHRSVVPEDCQAVYQDLLHRRVEEPCTVFRWSGSWTWPGSSSRPRT